MPLSRTEGAIARVDPCWGDAVAQVWRERLARGEWQDLGSFLAGQADTERRDFYVEVLAETLADRPDWLDTWVEAQPGQALPLLVRGRHSIIWAWQARSERTASSVKADGARLFWERLERAETDLAEAARCAPDDAGPWVLLLTVARGLSQGVPRLHQLYAEAQQRCPWHQEAHRAMIQGLAAKWGGSTEEMFEFARDVSVRAPDGWGVHTVLAEAHIEGWLEAEQKESYWQRPGVRAEILAAAARSIDVPHPRDSPWTRRNRNQFAFCYYRLKEHDRLSREFALIGPTVTSPWTLFEALSR